MLEEKNLVKAAWETLQTILVSAKRVKYAKVKILKSEFEAIYMKESESIEDFAMKETMIVTDIRFLGNKVEEIFIIKKFLLVVPLPKKKKKKSSCRLLPLLSSLATSRTCHRVGCWSS